MAKSNIAAFLCGLLFSIGLGISGMTQPQKVIGFLDVFGEWDQRPDSYTHLTLPTIPLVYTSVIAE